MSDARVTLRRHGVVAVLGALAGAVMAFALYSALPELAPRGSLALLACLGAAGVAIASLLWIRLGIRHPRRERRRLLGSLLCGVGLVLVLRPFHEAPVVWYLVGNQEAGRKVRFETIDPQWDVPYLAVANFHASTGPEGPDQPWRRRAQADVRGLTVLGPARFHIHATQPANALIDPDTQQRRPGLDGVTGVIQAGVQGVWSPVDRIELEPTASGWTDVSVVIPRGTERVALQWDPRGNMTCDYVLVAIDPPNADVFGVPRTLVMRLGEFLLLAALAALASVILGGVFALVGRASACPPARVVPAPAGFRTLDLALLAVVVLAPLAVAISVAPWFHAATTPVVVDWEAPQTAGVEVIFGDGPDDHVPGVRLDATRFGAELPPRPTYKISLKLRVEDAGASPPKAVNLFETRDGRVALSIPWSDFRPVPDGVKAASGPVLGTSLQVTCPSEIRLDDSLRWEAIWKVWAGGALALALLFLAIRILARHATTLDQPPPGAPGPILPLAISSIAIAVVTTVWALSVPTVVTEDTVNYLVKGEAIAQRGTFETGPGSGALIRTPGFPAFLAVVLKLYGHSFTAVAVAHGLFFAFALFFAAASLRTRVRTAWLVVGILLGGTLLPQLHFARIVMSESAFTSLSLIALGCFWFARSAAPGRSAAWMTAFGVVTGIAVYTRMIAIALLAVPAVTWLSGTIALWKTPTPFRTPLIQVLRHSLPYILTVGIVAAFVLGWSWRNNRLHGYFGLAAMESLSNLQGEVHAGTLDPRVLVPVGMYDQYVLERDRNKYVWTVWHIYGHVYRKAEAEVGQGNRLIRRAEDAYEELYRASNASKPLPARLVKFLRSAWWNLAVAMDRDYIRSVKVADPGYFYLNMTLNDARPKQAWVNAESRIPMSVADAPLTGIGELFRWVADSYVTWHLVLLLAGLLGCLLMLGAGAPGLAAPFVFVVANWVLLTYLRQHEVRYMIVVDVFCLLQIALALGRRWRAPLPAPPVPPAT